MTNLKKSLALVLVLVMALGLFTAGASFSDVPSAHQYKESIDTLSDLGILTGYTDGTFVPSGTITRAEACAVVYRSITGKTNSNAAGATAFSDVAGTHWASGFINYCTEMKIVNGYPDGTFKPNNPVTFAEMATMLVRALGLDDGTLSYPVGYLVMADSNYISDNVDLKANDPAPRGAVAEMAYHTIFDAKYAKLASDSNPYPTIAESVLQIKSFTGVVTAVGSDTITVGGKTASIKKDNSILGMKVKVSYKGAELNADAKTYAAVPTGNTVLELKAGDITEVTAGSEYTNKLTNKNFELDDATYILNGTGSSVGATLTGKVGANNLFAYKFIDNDGDKKYEYVIASSYKIATVERVTDSKLYLSGTGANHLDLKDSDGKATSVKVPTGIAKDDQVLVYEESTSKATVLLIPKATGTVSSYNGSKYTIGGTAYALLAGNSDITTASLGEEVDYYVDPVFGLIVKANAPSAVDNVLFVKDSKKTKPDPTSANLEPDDVYTAEVLFPDGTASTITLAAESDYDKVDDATKINTVWTYTVSEGKYTLVAQKAAASDGTASKDGSFISAGGVKYAVDKDSVIFVVGSDNKKVSAFVGTVPSFTASGSGVKYGITSEAVGGFSTIRYALIFVGANGTMASSEDTGVLGYVTSVRYEASAGSKYVAVYTIAANGAVNEYTTVPVSSNVAGEYPDYSEKFVSFDVTSDGIKKPVASTALDLKTGYVMGSNSGYYAIDYAKNGIDETLALASDVKVYTIDKDGKAAVGVVEDILKSSVYGDGYDIGYKVVYKKNTDGKIASIFVYTEPVSTIAAFNVPTV